jgi:nitroreductase
MPTLDLTPDALLTTTRAVRKRLDLSRPVEMEVIRACLGIALQAPSASNVQGWHFVVVTDAEKRAQLAELYRRGFEAYRSLPRAVGNLFQDDPVRGPQQRRVMDSSQYLAAHLEQVPVHVIPCIEGSADETSPMRIASRWGSLYPAAWSFMLAARARGLGTVWTTLHLLHEQEAAEILGIPYQDVRQGLLIPLAYTQGSDFQPAPRQPLDDLLHVNGW